MRSVSRVVLIGFSGGGKSTIAKILSDRLGWTAIDVDDQIAAEYGESIPSIFATHGEQEFRDIERRFLTKAVAADCVVVATGGGAVVDPEVWSNSLLKRPGTLVVALDVSPQIAFRRLQMQQVSEGAAVDRPMIAGDDPLERIRSLKSSRQAVYDRADLSLVVDNMPPEAVSAELASVIARNVESPSVTLKTPSGESEIFIAPGSRNRIGSLLKERWPKANRIWIITEENVGRFHMKSVLDVIRDGGFNADGIAIGPGETAKSFAGAELLYDWLLDGGIERGDVIVALGGGVVGDLAGFVAATCLRGVGLVQLPTSLLAMVDSSVGGKTGINHRAGKNLIGAFYQPPLVIIDSDFLQTLPAREFTSGWAEVIKHGVIQRSTPGGEWNDLFTMLERNKDRLQHIEEPALSYVIRRNVVLKAAVVEADERESGIRAYLNFGHTLGHAIEAAGYRYFHGEAIAVGMCAAGRIGVNTGLFDDESCQRLQVLISDYGLPIRAEVDREKVLSLIGSDKKRAAGTLRWVLPTTGGGVSIREDVAMSTVESVLAGVSDPLSAVAG